MHERWVQIYSIVARGDNFPVLVMLIAVAVMIGVAVERSLGKPR